MQLSGQLSQRSLLTSTLHLPTASCVRAVWRRPVSRGRRINTLPKVRCFFSVKQWMQNTLKLLPTSEGYSVIFMAESLFYTHITELHTKLMQIKQLRIWVHRVLQTVPQQEDGASANLSLCSNEVWKSPIIQSCSFSRIYACLHFLAVVKTFGH